MKKEKFLSAEEKRVRNKMKFIIFALMLVLMTVVIITATVLTWHDSFHRMMMLLWWLLYAVAVLAIIFKLEDLYKEF